MGACIATSSPASAEVIRRLLDATDAFEASRDMGFLEDAEELGGDAVAAYCILGGQPERFAAAADTLRRFRHIVAEGGDVDKEMLALDRSLGCVLGNAVGDALGAPMEFSHVRYGTKELTGMGHRKAWEEFGYNKFRVKPGQWTDDNAMALCITDSLLCCGQLDCLDIRQRFWLWNRYGYNNAFGRDPTRHRRSSVGLGGNIKQSIEEWEFAMLRRGETQEGNRFTNGNGSVMRNGAVPVWFRKDLKAGMAAAYRQSKTTHGGDEAAECCRLLTFICVRLLAGAGRKLLEDLSAFETPLYTVTCLAAAKPEARHPHNSDAVFGSIEDRVWDWRSPTHRYSERRARQQPGYVGSYCMDCLSMALHCVYSTQSFEDAALKAANLCGDADSVCAVACQIAGALYGVSAIPASWIEEVQRWDGGSIAARALMLHNHEVLPSGQALSDVACATAFALGTPCRPVDASGSR